MGETVKLATESITFLHQRQLCYGHAYPKSKDPMAGVDLKIFAKTGTTILINVGKSKDSDPICTQIC